MDRPFMSSSSTLIASALIVILILTQETSCHTTIGYEDITANSTHSGNILESVEIVTEREPAATTVKYCPDYQVHQNGTCQCRPGFYRDQNSRCRPMCEQGCIHGTCKGPGRCECNFGYVGANCSVACECNGHSNCPNETATSVCLECQNNTQGPHCERCKPWFVGNPANGGRCESCLIYCHGHSELCIPSELINGTNIMDAIEKIKTTKDLDGYVKDGPLSDAVCINCLHNTEGERCGTCIPGFFKKGESMFEVCEPCHCNSHGDMCDPNTGEGCNCANNTETDRQCIGRKHSSLSTPCWQLQCSKCREYYLGVPVSGHQCYRHMFLDKEYCADPDTQEECHRNPAPLANGRTVFFAVQPRYMNVDIRVVVDVASGAADFFLSSREDTFVVETNRSNGAHMIWLDDRYSVDYGIEEAFGRDQPVSYDDLLLVKKLDRYVNFNDSSILTSYGLLSAIDIGSPAIKVRQYEGAGLVTYLTISHPQELIVVRNLKNRLVITIPQEVHDLRSTRFYMVLRGVEPAGTFGNLFFRQDQSRIDLFVFFSVFFSCFFLFLASCVIIWKVKQGMDMRRARRLHAAEMKHMASRPFASALVKLEPTSALGDFGCDDSFEFALSSPVHQLNNSKKKQKTAFARTNPKDSPKHPSIGVSSERYLIRPLAVEPTCDGLSAIVSTLIVLPGGSQAPIRMTIGSTLVSNKGSQQQLSAANSGHTHAHHLHHGAARGAFHAVQRRRPRF